MAEEIKPADDNLDFSTAVVQEFPFEYPPKSGNHYILREASGDAAVKWRDEVFKSTILTDGKVSGVKNLASTEPYLVSLCCFKLGPDGTSRIPMTAAMVRDFPAHVLKRLYNKVVHISKLKEEDANTLDEKIAKAKKELKELEDLKAQQSKDEEEVKN